jgi:hypothetical protein
MSVIKKFEAKDFIKPILTGQFTIIFALIKTLQKLQTQAQIIKCTFSYHLVKFTKKIK